MKLLKSISEAVKLEEGFSGYRVISSDTAADCWGNCLDALATMLRKELNTSKKQKKQSKYNTSGAVNVAMILLEKLKKDVAMSMDLEQLAKDTADQLLVEALDTSLAPAHIKQLGKFAAQLDALVK